MHVVAQNTWIVLRFLKHGSTRIKAKTQPVQSVQTRTSLPRFQSFFFRKGWSGLKALELEVREELSTPLEVDWKTCGKSSWLHKSEPGNFRSRARGTADLPSSSPGLVSCHWEMPRWRLRNVKE